MAGNPNPKVEYIIATMWKPGQSGNPSGKPKGTKSRRGFKAILEEILAQEIDINDPITGLKTRRTIEECLALKQVEKALLKADSAVYQDIRDTVDGKIPQPPPSKDESSEERLSVVVNNIINNHKTAAEGARVAE